MADVHPNARINLERATVLLLDDTAEGMSILVQIVSAFGVRVIHRCHSDELARQKASAIALDLVLASGGLRDSSGYDFTSWLRRSGLRPNAFAPVIIIQGHTRLSDVQKTRECGANFIVAKPVSPAVLLERIVWVAREQRPFVSCATYVGPERRFHELDPPSGLGDRRRGDNAEPLDEVALPDVNTSPRVMEQAR